MPDLIRSRRRQRGIYQGSALLQSSGRRMARAAIVVGLMWALTAWALDWW